MAAAALIRLGLEERISKLISLDDLPVPEGQGYLSITFLKNGPVPPLLRPRFPMVGKTMLLTCSESLQSKARYAVFERGGMPISFPLIQTRCNNIPLPELRQFHWVIITSPSAVKCLQKHSFHPASCRWMSCGAETSRALEKIGIKSIHPPKNFGTKALLSFAKEHLNPGDKIIRLRSDKAGEKLAKSLREMGASVEDFILYSTQQSLKKIHPKFDFIFFASPSAVETFSNHWNIQQLEDKKVIAIGPPTFQSLEKQGIKNITLAPKATIISAVDACC
jgi:uroporphyrinogen-III synthase